MEHIYSYIYVWEGREQAREPWICFIHRTRDAGMYGDCDDNYERKCETLSSVLKGMGDMALICLWAPNHHVCF